MGLFDRLFPKREKIRPETEFRTLTAYSPHFTSWDGCVYESELVRASIDTVARHFSKMVVEFHGSAKPTLITKLRHRPNEWSTWSQFLYRCMTILMCQSNCVIIPIIDKYGEMQGIYPVVPSICSIKEFEGVPYLRMEFEDRKTAAIELEKVGILTRFQYRSDFFGDRGDALRPTLELIHMQNQAITEGVKNSASVRFIATLGNFANAEDLAEERRRFVDLNLKSHANNGGLLLFPNTYKDIKQISSTPFVVDADQEKLIRESVFDYYGVNEKLVQNCASPDELNAFQKGCIDPMAVQMAEVLTKMIYSLNEMSYGNYVELSSGRFGNMSFQEKVNFVSSMVDRGMLKVDEVRDIFGFEAMPDGQGQVTPIRGEYHYLENSEVDTDAQESE